MNSHVHAHPRKIILFSRKKEIKTMVHTSTVCVCVSIPKGMICLYCKFSFHMYVFVYYAFAKTTVNMSMLLSLFYTYFTPQKQSLLYSVFFYL